MILTNAILTAYCACKICCGPHATGITAIGTTPKQGITIAAPRNIPLGTKVKVANRTFTVQDRTARKYNGRWDIYFTSHQAAKQFGIRKINIWITQSSSK